MCREMHRVVVVVPPGGESWGRWSSPETSAHHSGDLTGVAWGRATGSRRREDKRGRNPPPRHAGEGGKRGRGRHLNAHSRSWPDTSPILARYLACPVHHIHPSRLEIIIFGKSIQPSKSVIHPQINPACPHPFRATTYEILVRSRWIRPRPRYLYLRFVPGFFSPSFQLLPPKAPSFPTSDCPSKQASRSPPLNESALSCICTPISCIAAAVIATANCKSATPGAGTRHSARHSVDLSPLQPPGKQASTHLPQSPEGYTPHHTKRRIEPPPVPGIRYLTGAPALSS